MSVTGKPTQLTYRAYITTCKYKNFSERKGPVLSSSSGNGKHLDVVWKVNKYNTRAITRKILM